MLLKITEKCSMGCSHCMNSATPDGAHMTEQTLKDALHFLWVNQSHAHIVVSGGEPTEHPEFEHMIQVIFDFFDKKNIYGMITITTNGFWCLDNIEAAKRIAKGTGRVQVLWQVSTDDRYYPKLLPTSKRLWREDGFVLCDRCVTQVYPQGNALKNELPWKAKASKCFNVRALVKQMPSPSIGLLVESLLTRGYFCTPAIRIDGKISLGESDLCPKVASIYDPEELIIEKIKSFQCSQCDFINDSLPYLYRKFVM